MQHSQMKARRVSKGRLEAAVPVGLIQSKRSKAIRTKNCLLEVPRMKTQIDKEGGAGVGVCPTQGEILGQAYFFITFPT